MKIIRLLIMLVLSVFLMQTAFAQLAPAKQLVFMAASFVLVDATVAMPTIPSKTSIAVTPANLPGHLNFTGIFSSKQRQAYIMFARAGHNKGGFQNVEVVLLFKSGTSINPGYSPTAI